MRYIREKLFRVLLVVSPIATVWLLGAMEQRLTGSWAEFAFGGLIVLWLWMIYQIKKAEREERRRERHERLSKGNLAA